ncbi:MAG: Hsp70 family protein [Planctomycetales bacterium]|nr:Hsp70 family protein [Planctomycetales bacterium]
MKPIIGIDLGTTKCVASVRLGDEFVEISPVSGRFGGLMMLPSVFVHPSSGKPVVGEDAVREYGSDPNYRGQVIRNVKRWMKLNYPVGGEPAKKFKSGNRDFTPAEVSSHFLRLLRDAAKRETDRLKARPSAHGLDWDNWLDAVVITVPAYFSPIERLATREAARLAGFVEGAVHLLDEPIAAALSEKFHEQTLKERIVVVDLGGGTCDLTLLETGENGFRELGRFGDNEFGGLEWDLELAQLALRKHPLPGVRHLMGDDGTPDYCRYGHLFDEAEKIKKVFCARENRHMKQSTVDVADPDQPKENGQAVINRQEFENLSNHLAQYCGQLADRLIESIDPTDVGATNTDQVSWAYINRVLLVGGGSQLVAVQEALQRRLNKTASLTIPQGSQLSVARGAAMFGQLLAKGVQLEGISHPRSPLDVGIMLIPVTAKPRFWRRWFGSGIKSSKGDGSPASKPSEIFRPLIKCNVQLPTSVSYKFPLDNNTARIVKLDVCFRQYTRRRPDGVLMLLRSFAFTDLPPCIDPIQDRLHVFMEYDDRYELHVKARVRNQDVTVTIRPDDFRDGVRLDNAP